MYATEAFILKKIDAGESDSLITLYTRQYGKMRVYTQGVKKEGAKLKGHCEPLNMATVQYVSGRSGERLTHATVSHSWPAIRAQFRKLSLAVVMADTLDRSCFPGEKDEAVWQTFLKYFEILEREEYHTDIAIRFEAELRAALGYGL